MSPSTFWLGPKAEQHDRPMIEPPIRMVEKSGAEEAGVDAAERLRDRLHCAIDRVVRAVGRIVVCVDAEADVSTEMISSLSTGEPRTPLPSGLSTSSGC